MKNQIGKFNWHTEKQSADFEVFNLNPGLPAFPEREK